MTTGESPMAGRSANPAHPSRNEKRYHACKRQWPAPAVANASLRLDRPNVDGRGLPFSINGH